MTVSRMDGFEGARQRTAVNDISLRAVTVHIT